MRSPTLVTDRKVGRFAVVVLVWRSRRRGAYLRSFALSAAIACAPAANSPDMSPGSPEVPSSSPQRSGAEPPVTAGAPPMVEHSDQSHEHGGPGSVTGQPRVAPTAPLEADEMTAHEKAKPVFAAHCARCHSNDGSKASKAARRHFDMDLYPFGGHHSSDVTKELRRVLGADGGKPTMPRDDPGAVAGAELELILAWAQAFDRARQHSEQSHAPDAHSH